MDELGRSGYSLATAILCGNPGLAKRFCHLKNASLPRHSCPLNAAMRWIAPAAHPLRQLE